MTKTEPRVYLLASTTMPIDNGYQDWLMELGASEFLEQFNDAHTASEDGPEELIEFAARRCYKSFGTELNKNLTKVRTESRGYIANVLDQQHGSVLAHASSTWAFEGVSRVFTHELVRNAVGNAFSQESMGYVRLDDIPFWFPPEIEEDEEGRQIFEETVEFLQKQIARLNAKKWRILAPLLPEPVSEHNHLKVRYLTIDEMPFSLKKKYTSLFRRLAPEGIATGIVVTHNMRSLRWIIEQRTDPAAEYEIRKVYNLVADISRERWPLLFQDFETRDTADGEVRQWIPKNHKI